MIFVADISANHNGKIEDAKKIMKDLKESSGNNLVIAKFQHWITDNFINAKQFRDLQKQSHQKNWKDSVYQTYKKYELPLLWLPELSDYAKELKIGFAVTCYDIESMDKINPYNDIWKVGSGDINHAELLIKAASYGKPVVIGTGASTIEEVIQAVNIVERINKNIVIMQCNTNYELTDDKLNYSCINVLKSYKTYFPKYDVGLSDHTISYFPAMLATSLGCGWIEKHFKGSIQTDSPDADFSLDIPNWKYLITQIGEAEKILGNTYKQVMPNEIDNRIIQRRCLYATKNLKAGSIIKLSDVIAMRPALPNCITPMVDLVGFKVKKDIEKDNPFTFENIDFKVGK